MTTEVAILNKSAVALAADSAVTITGRRPGENPVVAKIYVDANKLFELIKGVPVGVMIYNSAEIAGVPWETLIKVYRCEHPKARFDTLDAYVSHFLKFVESRIPTSLDYGARRDEVVGLAATQFRLIYDQLAGVLQHEPSRLERRRLYKEMLESVGEELDRTNRQEWAEGIDEAALWRAWGEEILNVIPQSTDELTLTIPLQRKSARVALKAVLRSEYVSDFSSGVVISGFGEAEMFPSVFHTQVNGLVADRLVSVSTTIDHIDNERPAIIRPYAQTSEATTFLMGIDPAVSSAISSFWRVWSRRVHSNVKTIVKKESPRISDEHLNAIDSRVQTFMDKSWRSFAQYMNTEFHERRLQPIEASAGFLSKREIADLAENLVEITSLRNRVSLDRQETVGGATDVGVISKGDGFVWVKRKHYFDRDRNPMWGLRQALTDVLSGVDGVATAGSERGEEA